LITEQEKSGRAVREFCRERDIGEHSFYMWRQRFRQDRPVTFALVETKPVAAAPSVIEVLLTTGDRLRIPGEPHILGMVLAVLRERHD
jgi:transposase-like protein